MVRGLDRVRHESKSGEEISPHSHQQSDFPATAPAANPVFFRTYSRFTATGRETWQQVCTRTLKGLVKLGKLTDPEADIIDRMQRQVKAMPSGRWLWVGGSEWLEQPQNFSGAYNCTSTNVCDWAAFALMMDLAMMGCGTGAILEPDQIGKLPVVKNQLNVTIISEIGKIPLTNRQELTTAEIARDRATITVGDSRQGWIKSYKTLLELSSDDRFNGEVQVSIDLSNVRPAGERLKGFGGVANPVKLTELYGRCASILNKAIGRQLNSVECCLLIDEAAVTIVAGNVRRSAGMRQYNSSDVLGSTAKDNLWQQDEHGNWRIDPDRDALRMANHTRVFHHKPTLEECVAAVQKQYYSGEGAIQWAGEAVARSNADLVNTPEIKTSFLQAYEGGNAKSWLQEKHPNLDEKELEHRLSRFGLNPCVTGETWIHTEYGAKLVKDLVGIQHGTYVNGEIFSTTTEGFFLTGYKPVVKLQTKSGYDLRLTPNHQVLKVTAQTQKKQYSEWCEAGELQPGDRILIHNHRDIAPWGGNGTSDEGWLLGSLVGDGCFSVNEASYSYAAKLRYWGKDQVAMKEFALAKLNDLPKPPERSFELTGTYHQRHQYYEVGSAGLARLATEFGMSQHHKQVTPEIERASYEFYQGFLRGLFDADGSVQGTQTKGISVRLAQNNLNTLSAIQRMLLRIGIASTVYQNRRPEGLRLLPDSNRELTEYHCQANHELVIANDNIQVFQNIIGFQEPEKSEKLSTLLAGYKRKLNRERFDVEIISIEADGFEAVYDCTVPGVSRFDANGFVAHNCGEILGTNFHCNLSEVHLNQIDPNNYKEQEEAFTAAGLSVATLLNHQFQEPRYQYSRELDPIVGVSFTGLFDFFVHAFGSEWLQWWAEGRPATEAGIAYKQKEHEYLNTWRTVVERTVWAYCDKHGIKRPNRCTTVQPSGTKSLLTGASPGWHPPKAQRFIRRITFRKNDPVAMACIDYGYSVIPSQSDKDEHGNLLDNAFDPRCTEWLIEIPVAVSWADIPGADVIEIGQFSALTQMDFYMGVQQHYVRHNTSATIELREHEVDELGQRIYEAIQNDEGYISAALLARFDDHQTFPRLPFEPIDKATYDEMMVGVLARRQTVEFHTALSRYDLGNATTESGPAGCDSDKCLLPDVKPNN
jgi:ribonucleotide reductase, class II